LIHDRVAALDGRESAWRPTVVPAQDLGRREVVLDGHGAKAVVVEDLQPLSCSSFTGSPSLSLSSSTFSFLSTAAPADPFTVIVTVADASRELVRRANRAWSRALRFVSMTETHGDGGGGCWEQA
jgi:hypothetical protein